MQSYSALYINSATIAIVGQGGMKELKGQGQSGNYGIFWIRSSKVHLENLKIMNGYVSMNCFFSTSCMSRQKISGMLNGFDCCCRWCIGRFVGSKYKDLKGRQKICGMLTLVWF